MKVQERSLQKFLKAGEDNFDFGNFDEDMLMKVQPMRSLITKNKKEDAKVYKNSDAKRFHKK